MKRLTPLQAPASFAPAPAPSPVAALDVLSGILQAGRMEASARRDAGMVPLVVICGFLGAGKTTLVNHLLTHAGGRRLAVVVNDFGRLNIDADLVRSRSAETIELTNGCACCSLAGDLAATLRGLTAASRRPDAVVVEASGLSDPRGLIQVALANPMLRLESVVGVVDGELFAARAADADCAALIEAQVSAADIVVLNKVDLLDPAGLQDARTALARLAPPGLQILEAAHGEVALDLLLGPGPPRERELRRATLTAHGFESWDLRTGARLSRKAFADWMAGMSEGLFRAKGFLWLVEDPRHRILYQRVGRRWSFSRLDAWDAAGPRSALVLIGRAGAFDRADLAARFDACRPGPISP